MFMDSYVSWEPRGTYGKIEPATRIAEKYASGEIALGGSVDTIFAEIQLKEAEKQERLREEARIEKENAAKELIEKPLREAREKIAAEEKKRTDESMNIFSLSIVKWSLLYALYRFDINPAYLESTSKKSLDSGIFSFRAIILPLCPFVRIFVGISIFIYISCPRKREQCTKRELNP